ncbi:alpha/beta hydrolase [Saccharopolyspora sp. 6M]|uniref:alpha/beta hydrolase n=1 Tax=Saccharopolyspora sp. 6M TaxID=2877237 RepID=UPI001CD43DEF|nr:alpha/beta hydrolase [Saccharopolyspora sp. 6M]MCA1229151.1 alpha/beta hydrolase family protein [Saccharopolyspora sp. 6M]
MVLLGDLRRWNADLLDDAIDELKDRQDRLVQLDDELAGSGRPREWQGKAADAATAEHAKLGERLRELVLEISTVRTAAIATADEIRAVGNELVEADALAHAHHFAITDDGGVDDLGTPPGTRPDEAADVDADRHERIRPDLVHRVERILARADDADRELAKVLGDADKDLMDTGGAKTLADAAALGDARGLGETIEPPPPGDPAKNAEWWKSLPAETKSALAAAPPAWLGGMDGIPATVRHTANVNKIDDERAVLNAEANRLREQIKKVPKGPGARNLEAEYRRPLDQVEAKLKSLDEVEATAKKTDRQLLVLDTSGERTKAAIAVGNVDTAEHVSVFTPGLNSTVEGGSLNDYDKSMDLLQQDATAQSQQYGDGGDVAAVTWLGYEAPQINDSLGSDSVASSTSAERGGDKLADFYRGINASRDDNPHLVAMGHSYGSTTTGYALQHDGVGVDAAVVMGSPGVGTAHPSELNVPAGQLYNIESKRDLVADLSWFGGDPSKQADFRHLSTGEEITPDGQHLNESIGHNTGGPDGYLNRGNTSQYNAAAVAAGLPDRTVVERR